MRILRLLAAATLLTTVAVGCDRPSNNPPPPPQPTTTRPSTTSGPTSTATRTPTSTATPTVTGVPYSTDPVTVDHNPSVPPIPVLTGIRPAQHPQEGFDRITFDFSGNDNAELPGYDVRYVDEPTDCGTGDPSNVTGRRFLQIRFEPTDAHAQDGSPTVPRSANLGYPQLQSYKITCDFEAVVVVVLGLDDVVGFRVGELSNRIYVDVAA